MATGAVLAKAKGNVVCTVAFLLPFVTELPPKKPYCINVPSGNLLYPLPP